MSNESDRVKKAVDGMFSAMQRDQAVAQNFEKSDALLAQLNKNIAKLRKTPSQIASEKLRSELRQSLLNETEEGLGSVRSALACPDNTPPTLETLADAISSLADSVESMLKAIRGSV